MQIYYNENNPKMVKWLSALIASNLLPQGDIDDRSIEQVQPCELSGYDQCHFFAGIGGWPLALQLAGARDLSCWTGSCPCQPFSSAGRKLGTADPRHLWPVWFRLIQACQPATVFGEQVASPAGRKWLAGVFADLETMDYRRAGADLCAAGVGAPHIRQRLFWVANTVCTQNQRDESGGLQQEFAGCGRGMVGGLGDANEPGPQGRVECEERARKLATRAAGAWSDSRLIHFTDGKKRRIESGLEPLAHGIPQRVVRLHGYGNAIVPQVGAVFIRSALEAIQQV